MIRDPVHDFLFSVALEEINERQGDKIHRSKFSFPPPINSRAQLIVDVIIKGVRGKNHFVRAQFRSQPMYHGSKSLSPKIKDIIVIIYNEINDIFVTIYRKLYLTNL